MDLSNWSRNNIGNVNEKANEWEAKIEILEDHNIMHNNEHPREELNRGFIPFSVHAKGPQITHLTYADGIVIFSSGNTRTNAVGKRWILGNSQAWKCLLLARDKEEKCIIWKINRGNNNFWWDQWIENGPLANICPEQMQGRISKLKVKVFLTNNTWNLQKLYNTIPGQMALHISPIEIGIPFKFSFICWRLFFGKLPFNEIRAKYGNQDDIGCLCCNTSQVETIQHVFVEGDAAKNLWNKIGASLGIKHQLVLVIVVMQKWWNSKPRNRVHKTCLQIAPVVICWEIWKAWTLCRYGGKIKFYQYSMVTQCMLNIRSVLNNTFPKWNKPGEGVVKLNTDGSYTSANNKAGIGGFLRDEHGDFTMAFSKAVECTNNNQAKALAADFGIKWCFRNGFNNFHIELDSTAITNMIIQKDTNNLKLKHIINAITNRVRGANATVLIV
ncbi:uncharacterized protein LOC132054015 [Lycium ferocissimum]|uniref:uncharacterized protein LOC132054015 n=1 Tax=Lycium ferocissimum TaxID=112874 RepID=UPI002816445E|nr:uncharacterized protein LOC132054015 [Lycium ferocissimum]